MTKYWLIVFSLIFLSLSSESTSLKIKINGIDNIKGQLMIGVYSDETNFPKHDKATLNKIYKVTSKAPVIILNDLKIGKSYAVAVYHDENSNKRLDKNLFGLPTEKYGFSNNARGVFGPPYFSDASFKLSKDTALSIDIK